MAAEGFDCAVAADMLAVLQPIAPRHDDPAAYCRGVQFETLIERWRPDLAQASS